MSLKTNIKVTSAPTVFGFGPMADDDFDPLQVEDNELILDVHVKSIRQFPILKDKKFNLLLNPKKYNDEFYILEIEIESIESFVKEINQKVVVHPNLFIEIYDTYRE